MKIYLQATTQNICHTEDHSVMSEVVQFGEHLTALFRGCGIVPVKYTGRQFMKCVIQSPHHQIEQFSPTPPERYEHPCLVTTSRPSVKSQAVVPIDTVAEEIELDSVGVLSPFKFGLEGVALR
ncbi:MAG: hypothetical protein AAGA30_13485 [Planctomycetota bacterium]